MTDKIVTNEIRKTPLRLQSAVCFAMCFTVSLTGLWLASYMLLNNDMAAILSFAQEILRGKRLYVDLITWQLPFILYFAMLPIGIHAVTGMSVPDAFFLFVFLLLQLSTLFSWRILRRHPLCHTVMQRYAVLFALYFGFFILPLQGDLFLNNFGQRENLFCALILPYVALMLNRLQGIESTHGEEAFAGMLATLGFCIKPPFAILFILAELFLMLARRRFFASSRLDAWIIVLLSLSYYALVIVTKPEYFRLIPELAFSYKGYESPWSYIVFFVLLTASIPAIVVFRFRRSEHFKALLFILTVIAGGELVYAVQKSAYFYRLLPAYFFSLILFVLAALASRRSLIAFLLVPLFAVYVCLETFVPEPWRFIARHDDTLAKAVLLSHYKTVVALSVSHMDYFPAINYAGAEWALSTVSLEYLPTAYMQWNKTSAEPPYRAPAEMGDKERFFHEIIIRDLQRLPDAILVDTSPVKYYLEGMKFDYLHYFMQDPRFRELWKHYEFVTDFKDQYDSRIRISTTHPFSSEAIYRRKD